MEIFRKKSIKNAQKVFFDVFTDMLKEIFFVKETEETILLKQREIKVLDESNLAWSMDTKKDVLAYIKQLQLAPRDETKDDLYFLMAH